VPAPAIQHVDLCVSDVDRSRAFYLEVLGPVGLQEDVVFRSYRGTEDIVYLRYGEQNLGLRPADGGRHEYHNVGLEHLAFEVERREQVDEAYARAVAFGAEIHFPPEDDDDLADYYAFFVFDPDGLRIEVFSAPPPPAEGSRWA
jgi:catechol 2,3-dioxygenase-like lactoylglutathione lyase family enzyme